VKRKERMEHLELHVDPLIITAVVVALVVAAFAAYLNFEKKEKEKEK